MLPDKLKRWLITNRAWEVYSLWQKLPNQEISQPADIDAQVGLAVLSDILQLHVAWPSSNKRLSVRETYTFPQNRLCLASYSYALIEIGERAIIRADSSPHHERDFRGKLLTRFPHHLHDEKGRICSFSGKLEDFIKLVAPYLN
jgi:hypothetical protein